MSSTAITAAVSFCRGLIPTMMPRALVTRVHIAPVSMALYAIVSIWHNTPYEGAPRVPRQAGAAGWVDRGNEDLGSAGIGAGQRTSSEVQPVLWTAWGAAGRLRQRARQGRSPAPSRQARAVQLQHAGAA